ncbi:MAG TPA: hypothetical protein VFT75_07060 [Nocardioidaceae bacterium]|jgi:hypothetical protein|nr:hypothetical protein [Nocardioidaceae bacterium]
MRTVTKLAAAAAGALLAAGVAAPAMAAPGDHGNGVGGCIDQLYGNATNPRPSGHGVLPSQSPGPWVNNPDDPANPTWGPTLGSLIQQYDFTPAQLRTSGTCPF